MRHRLTSESPHFTNSCGQRVVAVSAGDYHSHAITADGAVWSWGSNMFNVLGNGDEPDRYLMPQRIDAFNGRRVVAVSTKQYHSIAITVDGSAWTWGAIDLRGGAIELLGRSVPRRTSPASASMPQKITSIAGQRVVAVSAGAQSTLVLTSDGGLWSCGLGHQGTLGHGSFHNKRLLKKIDALAGRRVVAISAGDLQSLARTADGATFSWGKMRPSAARYDLRPKQIEA